MTLAVSYPTKKVSAWIAETSIESTQAWLTRLPVADSAETARELYQALYTLNRMEMSTKARIDLMELYRQPVAQVTGKLHGRLANTGFPLSAKKKQLAEFVRDLQSEMANGYKLALVELERVKMPLWGKGSTRILASYRSLHYLGNVVLRSAYYYLPYPKNLWKEIHALYDFSEKNNFAEEPVQEFSETSGKTSSVLKRYKEILLLGLADPYQMPFGQCKNINEYIYRWADLTFLQPMGAGTQKANNSFLVNLQGNIPGQNTGSLATDRLDQENWRSLDTSALVDNISSQIRRLRTGTRASELELGTECLEEFCLDMLKRLERAWVGGSRRQSSRLQMNGQVSLCNGIASIHYYAQEEFLQNTSPHAPAARLVGAANKSSSTFKVDRWDMLDASAGGVQIRGNRDAGLNLRVGDLAGVLGEKKSVPLKLFCVRWIREGGANGVEVGLELISTKIIPVLVGEEHGAGGFVPCMILEKGMLRGSPVPRTLLLPRRLRGNQKTIELVEPGDTKSRWVRVLDVVEESISYERVTFASLSERSKS